MSQQPSQQSQELSMQQPQSPAEIPSYVHLFQKAHQNIGLLEQIDEQLAQLWTRRQELQKELRTLQAQITEELEDWITAAGEPPKQILTAIAHSAGGIAGANGNLPPLAQRVNASAAPRFATQPLSGAAPD